MTYAGVRTLQSLAIQNVSCYGCSHWLGLTLCLAWTRDTSRLLRSLVASALFKHQSWLNDPVYFKASIKSEMEVSTESKGCGSLSYIFSWFLSNLILNTPRDGLSSLFLEDFSCIIIFTVRKFSFSFGRNFLFFLFKIAFWLFCDKPD